MKVCERCGVEIGTPDGENRCVTCETIHSKRVRRQLTRRTIRAIYEQAYRDAGLVKVRGALGGTYWE